MPPKSGAQPSLFDDALNPAPASPLAERHEPRAASSYSAKDIEVLEGLEPVRKRPGMYIGGTDERALHHLFAEVLDNSVDEAIAGHAKLIEITLAADGALTVKDDARGMPVDPHPKFPELSALEVILTMLHSGGKFSGKRPTRPQAACTESASRWSTPSPNAWKSPSGRTALSGARPIRAANPPRS